MSRKSSRFLADSNLAPASSDVNCTAVSPPAALSRASIQIFGSFASIVRSPRATASVMALNSSKVPVLVRSILVVIAHLFLAEFVPLHCKNLQAIPRGRDTGMRPVFGFHRGADGHIWSAGGHHGHCPCRKSAGGR